MFFKSSSDRLILEIRQNDFQMVFFKGGKLQAHKIIEIPSGIRGNEFQEDNLLHSALDAFRKEFHIEEKLSAALYCCRSFFSLKLAELPDVPPAKLRSLIFWDLSSHFNAEPDEIYWDFRVLERLGNGNCRVMICAVKKNEWDRYSAIFNSVGLLLDGIEVPSLNFQALLERRTETKGQSVAVYFVDETALCTFFVDSVPVFYREIGFSSYDSNGLERLRERWEHTLAFFQASFRFFVSKVFISGQIPDSFASELNGVFGKEVTGINEVTDAGVRDSSMIPLAASALRQESAFSSRRFTAELEMHSDKPKLSLSMPDMKHGIVPVMGVIVVIMFYLGLFLQNRHLAGELSRAYQTRQEYYPVIRNLEEVKIQKDRLILKEKLIAGMEGQRIRINGFLATLCEQLPLSSWFKSLVVGDENNEVKLAFSGVTGDYYGQISFLENMKKLDGVTAVSFDSMKQIKEGLWEFSFTARLKKR
ncbi:MAG: hypothetical protein PHQ23_05765 [Candidatus Wallbacteria bacterium]|nr:hypothetical protein [Candidatus Wallbacteria bacterium]